MDSKDKAKTTIPESPAQTFLRQVDQRDRRLRVFEMFILLALVVFSVFTSLRLQYIIDKNQEDVLVARKANVERQEDLKDYIKCILLIRFDVPPKELSTRKGVERALDQCAGRVAVSPSKDD